MQRDIKRRREVTLQSGGNNPLLTQNQLAQAATPVAPPPQVPLNPLMGALAPTLTPAPSPLGEPAQGLPAGTSVSPLQRGTTVDWTGAKEAMGEAYSNASTFTRQEIIDDFAAKEAERLGLSAQDAKVLRAQIMDIERDSFKEDRRGGMFRTLAGTAVGSAGGLVRSVGDVIDAGQRFVTGDTTPNVLARAGRSIQEFARDNVISPQMADNRKRVSELVAKGDVGGAIDFLLSNPSTIAQMAGEELLPVLIPVGAGATAGRLAVSAVRATGATQASIQAAPAALQAAKTIIPRMGANTTQAARPVTTLTEAVREAERFQKRARRAYKAGAATGMAGAQVSMVNGAIINELAEQGVEITPDVIRNANYVSLASGGLAVAMLPLGTLEGSLMRAFAPATAKGVTQEVVDKAAQSTLAALMSRGLIGKTASGGLGLVRNVVPDMVQEAADEFMQAVAMSSIDPETGEFDWSRVDWEEAQAQAAVGGIVGGAMGGAVNTVTRRRTQRDERSKDGETTDSPEPTSPDDGETDGEMLSGLRETFRQERQQAAEEAEPQQATWREALGADRGVIEQILMENVTATQRLTRTRPPEGLDALAQAQWARNELSVRRDILGEAFGEKEQAQLDSLEAILDRVESLIEERMQQGANWQFGEGGITPPPSRAQLPRNTERAQGAPDNPDQILALEGPPPRLALPAPVYLLPAPDPTMFVDPSGRAMSTLQFRDRERMEEQLGLTQDVKRAILQRYKSENEALGNTTAGSNVPLLLGYEGVTYFVTPDGKIMDRNAARMYAREMEILGMDPATRRVVEQHERRLAQELDNPTNPDAPMIIETPEGSIAIDNNGVVIPLEQAIAIANNSLLAQLDPALRKVVMEYQARVDGAVSIMDPTGTTTPLLPHDPTLYATSDGQVGDAQAIRELSDQRELLGLDPSTRRAIDQHAQRQAQAERAPQEDVLRAPARSEAAPPMLPYNPTLYATPDGQVGDAQALQQAQAAREAMGLAELPQNPTWTPRRDTLSERDREALIRRDAQEVVYFAEIGLVPPRFLMQNRFNDPDIGAAVASKEIPDVDPTNTASINRTRTAQRAAVARGLKAAEPKLVVERRVVDGEPVEIDRTPALVREDISRLESMQKILSGQRPHVPSPTNPLVRNPVPAIGVKNPLLKTMGENEGASAHWDSRSLDEVIPEKTIVRDGSVFYAYSSETVKHWLQQIIPESDPLRPIVDWLVERTDISPPVISSEGPLRVYDIANGDTTGTVVQGVFDPHYGTVYINGAGRAQPSTIIHEMIHAAVHEALTNPHLLNSEQKAALERLQYMFEYHRKKDTMRHKDGSRHNAISNLAEFVAEVMSNERVRQEVDNTPLPDNRSRLRKFWDAIKQLLFGTSQPDPALSISLDQVFQDVQTLAGFRVGMEGKVVTEMMLRPSDEVTSYILRDKRSGVQMGSAVLDPDTGLWNFQWQTDHGQELSLDGIDYDFLHSTADGLGLRADARSKAANFEDNAEFNIDLTKTFHPMTSKILSHMEGIFGSRFTSRVVDAGRAATTSFVSRFEPIVRIQNYLNRTRGTNYNVVGEMIQEYARGRAQTTRQGMASEPSLYDLKMATNQLLKESGLSADMMSDYLYARAARTIHAELSESPDPLTGLERVDRTTGFSFKDKNGNVIQDPDGTKFMATLTIEQKRMLDEITEPLRRANRMVLEAELASGIIGEREFYALSHFKDYVPLRNAEKDNLLIDMKRAGRYSKADDPYTMMIALLDARMMRVAHNNALGKLHDMLTEHPLPEFAEINAQDFDEPSGTWKNSDSFGKNSAYYYRDGKRYQIVARDPELRKAFERRELGPILSTMSNFTQFFSMARTQLNPAFLFKTLTQWDAITAAVNAQGAFQGQVADHEAMAVAQGIFRLGFGNVKDIFKSNTVGTDNFMVRAYHAFGGGIQLGSRASFENAAAKMKQMGTLPADSTIDMIRNRAAKAMSDVNEALHSLEDIYRFGAFMSYLELRHGRPFKNEAELMRFARANPEHMTTAVMGSKNIITNFELRGTNQSVRAMFAFFNAAIQGTFGTLPQIMNSAHGRKMVALLMMGSAAMFQGVMDEMGEDDDGKNKAMRLQGLGTKVFLSPDHSIELVHELRWANAAAQALIATINGQMSPTEASVFASKAFLDATNPINEGPSNDFGLKLANAMTPSVLQWVIPLATERDAFGRPLRAEYVYDPITGKRIERPASYESGVGGDSMWAKDAAAWLARTTDGAVDLLPSTIENAIRHIVGANYDNVRAIVKEMNNEGEDASSAIFNVLTRSTQAKYDEFAILNSYREMEAKWMAAERRALAETGGAVDLLAGRGQTAAKIARQIRTTNEELKELRIDGMAAKDIFRLRDQAQRDGDVDALQHVKELLERYYSQRRKIMGDALTIINNLEQE